MHRGSTRGILTVITVIFLVMAIHGCSSDNSSSPKVEYSWKQEVTNVTDILYGVSGTSSDNVYFGGENGRLLHWDGTSITPMERVCTSRINDIFALNENSIWICTYNDSIFHYNGMTWEKYRGNTGKDLWTVFAFSDTDVWVAGSEGVVSHFNGIWSPGIVGTTGDYWQGMWGSASNNIILVGYDERIYKYTGTWNLILPTGLDNTCTDVWGTSADNIYISAFSKIFHYSGGVSLDPSYWDLSPTRYYGIWGSSASDIFAVGNDGKIVHWNGSSWQYMTSNTILHFRSVWGSGSKDVFAIGGSGLIMHYCAD
ncbi:MAG: hypothetical protein JW746_05905 [Candidatus Krumholzibacteriota bacterium]|nr:hypothetical protein [Candidatus Krumholzibacteriota bacterium]